MRLLHILGLVFLLSLVSVSAYDINETINITAEYRESGILTASTATLSVYDPLFNLLVDSVTMNISATGKFFYEYTTPSHPQGEYTTTVEFYVGAAKQGEDTQTFIVGDADAIDWGVCPTSTRGKTILYVMIGLFVIAGFIGLMSQYPAIMVIAGILILFMTLLIGACGGALPWITGIIGALFMGIAGIIKT